LLYSVGPRVSENGNNISKDPSSSPVTVDMLQTRGVACEDVAIKKEPPTKSKELAKKYAVSFFNLFNSPKSPC
jgi:hypothetical protein